VTAELILDEREVNEFLGIKVAPPSTVNVTVLNAAPPNPDGTPGRLHRWLRRDELLGALRAEAETIDVPEFHAFINRLAEATARH